MSRVALGTSFAHAGTVRCERHKCLFNKATLFGDLHYYNLAFFVTLEKLVLEVGHSHHKTRKDVILAWKAGNIQWGHKYGHLEKWFPSLCVEDITCDYLQEKQISYWDCICRWSNRKFPDRLNEKNVYNIEFRKQICLRLKKKKVTLTKNVGVVIGTCNTLLANKSADRDVFKGCIMQLAISIACKNKILKPESVFKKCILSNIHVRVDLEYRRQETAPRRQHQRPARAMDRGAPLSRSRARPMDQPRIYATSSTDRWTTPAQQGEISLDRSLQCVSHAFLVQAGISIAVTLFLFKRFWDQFQYGVGISSTRQAVLRTPTGCPKIQLSRTLSTWRQHQVPQAKGSVLHHCPPPSFKCQL